MLEYLSLLQWNYVNLMLKKAILNTRWKSCRPVNPILHWIVPMIQTSVKFRDFLDLYLRQFSTNHFETCQSDVALLKLHRSYCISFNSSNLGNFFLEMNSKRLYLSSEYSKKKVVALCSRSPKNMKLDIFTQQSCSDGKIIRLIQQQNGNVS